MSTPLPLPHPQRDKQTETTSLAGFQTGTRSHVPLWSRVSRPSSVRWVRPPGRSSWTLPVEEAPAKLSPSVLLGTKTWARLQNQTRASASRLPICRSPSPPALPPLHHPTVFFLFFSFLPFCAVLCSPPRRAGDARHSALYLFCSSALFPLLSSMTRDDVVVWATLPARRPPSPSTVVSTPLVCLIVPHPEKKRRDENLAAIRGRKDISPAIFQTLEAFLTAHQHLYGCTLIHV